VSLGLWEVAGETFVTDFCQGAGTEALSTAVLQAVNVARLKLDARRCFRLGEQSFGILVWLSSVYGFTFLDKGL